MHQDSKRRPQSKARTMNRKAQRREKSARLFLCLAFPADSFPFHTMGAR